MMKRKPHRQAAWLVFGLIVCVYAVAALRFPMVYVWATYEDLFGEWIQFWALVVTLVFAVRLSRRQWRYRWFFGVLALGSFYVAMEEISWGQRLLGYGSPEFFRTTNLQGETNFHNILTGPYTTSLKDALSYGLSAALVLYGFIYPLAHRFRIRLAVWMDARGVAAPPLYVWPFFVLAAILELGLIKFNEAEVGEILVGVALAFTVVQYEFARRRGLELGGKLAWPAAEARRLATRMWVVALLIVVLSVATTGAVYASPRLRAKIDRRIDNGVEKFAKRYARYGRWATAIDLYRRTLMRDPRNTYILRKIADAYTHMGDDHGAERFLNTALAIDLDRYRRDRRSASVNRSLVHTYRMLGDHARADKHLREALNIGLAQVKRNPDSARAAYSLGRTYTMMRRYTDAFAELQRAHRLMPSSKRIRKAYYRARTKVNR